MVHIVETLAVKDFFVSAKASLLVSNVHAIEEDLRQTELKPSTPSTRNLRNTRLQHIRNVEAEMQIKLSPFR